MIDETTYLLIVWWIWIGFFIFAIVAALWVIGDAKIRRKSRFAAGLMVFASAFFGPPAVIIVLCAWVLLRPEVHPRRTTNTREALPDDLPSNLVVGPSTSEFLDDMARTR